MSDVYEGEWVISSLLADRAERLGDRVYVRSAAGDLTYGQLADRASRVAGGLTELGVEPGDRVATMLSPTIDYLAAWFGIVWAGAVDVPVNNEFKGEFLRHLVADSAARAIIIQDRWLSRLDGLDLPDIEHVVVVGEGGERTFQDLLGHEPVDRVPRHESDLAYIMYTSGTTGPSKGVMLSNRTALWNAYPWLDIVDLQPDDVAYSVFPLFHVTARSAIMTSSMWAGSSVVLRDQFSLSEFWDDIRETGSTWFGYMGAVIHLLHSQPVSPLDAENTATRAFGAAAPPGIIADFERRFGMRLIELYGSTELGPATAPGEDRRIGTQGKPLSHVEIEIHDELDRVVPVGEEGEIVVRPAVPDGVFQGYWGLPDATVAAFRNLWFHTGDGGRLDEEGNLTFTDRIKDSLRRRGENISSFEVERAVQSHPAVLECAAFAVPSELTEDEVMISVVLSEGADLGPAELFQHCIDEMPRFAVPRYLRFVSSLPKTPSQRIQKFKLRDEGVTDDTHDRQAMGIVVPRDS